jgi:hypothetical protein
MNPQKVNSAVKLLILLAGLSNSSCLIANEPFMLVSEEEYLLQLDQKNVKHKKMKLKMRSISGTDQESPLITINSPLVTSELHSPIRIEINFKAPDDANIQVDSLKVMYGWLNLDITDRIRLHAQISHAGILAENVELPVGKHNITIEITDTMERSAEKEFSFEILKP